MNTPKLPTLPFAVFDEFGQPCEDRVRDHFAAAFEELRAQIGHGVSDGSALQIEASVIQAQKVLSDWNEWYGLNGGNAPLPPSGIVKAQEMLAEVRSLLTAAPPAPQALTTCNCRWDGDTQVQQCTLHQAHIDAIHEWAERAKTAEAELATQQQKPLTDEQITAGAKALCKRSSEICGVNADDNWNLESEYFKDDARCVLEAAHNIGEKK